MPPSRNMAQSALEALEAQKAPPRVKALKMHACTRPQRNTQQDNICECQQRERRKLGTLQEIYQKPSSSCRKYAPR